MFEMFLRVSKYPPNVIFPLMQCSIRRATCKRNQLNKVVQYKTACVELAFTRPMLYIVFSSISLKMRREWAREIEQGKEGRSCSTGVYVEDN